MDGLVMKYFVVNPNKLGPYGKASREAMYTYARSIEEENPKLSTDLLGWLRGIEQDLIEKQ